MYPPIVRTGTFVLEGVNSLALVYYFLYLYFYMQERFGFTSRDNLLLAAFTGGIYTITAMAGGRFGQRRGYFKALKLGYAITGAALAVGSGVDTVAGQVTVLGVATAGMCFTWPNLEAIVCEGADPRHTQRMVGIYNLVWATSNAVAYFTGGAMIEALGYGSIFLVPAVLLAGQFAFTAWLEERAHAAPSSAAAGSGAGMEKPPLNPRPIARARTFMRMAWLANPLAYVAMGTVLPVIPTIASQLALSPKLAGFFCSIWQFARAVTFLGLWLWSGWHYRFRWLAGAALAMAAGYAALLLVQDLWVLLAAQLVFGWAVGVIYYSSLFYSMDVGDAKGEQGGIHEAAIGAGNCAGPLVGAGALFFFPATASAGVLAVGTVLLAGCLGMFTMHGRYRASTRSGTG